MDSKYILGISYNYHDAAAALLRDGATIAASTEERHSRRKHDPNFPARAIQACLDIAEIRINDLDWVVYYEQPLLKFARILDTAVWSWMNGGKAFLRSTSATWAVKGKFDVAEVISHSLGLPESRIRFCEHHLSHAASAFFCSPFERAAIVTIDGVGEWETATMSIGAGNNIQKKGSVRLPSSLGLFYSAMTAFLGFEVNEGEYKVMGMAAFGKPTFADEMLSWFRLLPGGGFRVTRRMVDLSDDGELSLPKSLTTRFGTPRRADKPFDPDADQHYADIAASVQTVTEFVVEHVVRQTLQKTGERALCLAGGVALNSAANNRLRRRIGVPMFVQPAAGDAGGALGAAKWFYHCKLGGNRREAMTTAALGTSCSVEDVRTVLDAQYSPSEWTEYPDSDALCAAIAQMLNDSKVVGWVQGRSEWGPRALGHRSILATPCRADMQAIVNEKIKFRETFRPFAPAVIESRAREFFDIIDIEGEDGASNPYNFMLSVCYVKPEAAARIPAVTHVDGSARVQTVRPEINPLFHRLIERFGELSGVPVLLNTSFNLKGEPIVNDAQDAIHTFEWSGMDALVLGRFVISK